MQFELIPLRLDFVAENAIHFPPGKAANILRGAFGMALRRVAEGRYAGIFQPRTDGGPSGISDAPRPFVFRARHLDGLTAMPKQPFHFWVHLFTLDPQARDAVAAAFTEAAREGFGTGRGKAELTAISGIPTSVDLAPREEPPERIRVEFLSPTELKYQERVVDRPEFPILLARCRDRVGTLRALYGAGPLAIDFAGLGERAAAVRMTRCELRTVEVERRSSRTGQSHSIGGFTGTAEYEGDLGEFLPYLEAAHWTGVGRQAVWGKGEIAVSRA